jgi:hypothetical protein
VFETFSQASTAGAGSTFMASETTFVSSKINRRVPRDRAPFGPAF